VVAWLDCCQLHLNERVSFSRTSVQILLIRKHQQKRILHFPVLDDSCEFRLRLVDAVAVVGVDDED
jgi:hypothetical protein